MPKTTFARQSSCAVAAELLPCGAPALGSLCHLCHLLLASSASLTALQAAETASPGRSSPLPCHPHPCPRGSSRFAPPGGAAGRGRSPLPFHTVPVCSLPRSAAALPPPTPCSQGEAWSRSPSSAWSLHPQPVTFTAFSCPYQPQSSRADRGKGCRRSQLAGAQLSSVSGTGPGTAWGFPINELL